MKRQRLNGLRLLLSLVLAVSFELPAQESAVDPDQPGKNLQQYDQFKGKAIYPEFYSFYIYPTYYRLPPEKHYVKNILNSLVSSNLSIQKMVYIDNPQPLKIYYPYQTKTNPETEPKALPEDRKDAFIKSLPAPSHYYSIRYAKPGKSPLPAYEFLSRLGEPEKRKQLGALLNPTSFHLFQSIEQKGEKFIIETWLFYGPRLLMKERNIVEEDNMDEAAWKITNRMRDILSGPGTGTLLVFSNVDRSSVYLNETFLGKTPLSFSHLIPGKYTLRVTKEGHNDWVRDIDIGENKKREFNANMLKSRGNLSMRVISNPEKADVFLNINYAGQTPLTLSDLPPGQYRIRLVREGYIDQYMTVELKENASEKTYYFNLKKGDPKEVYTPNREIIGGITYRQLFKASSFLTGALALTGIYFNVLSDNAASEAESRRVYAGGSPGPSEAKRIEKLNAEAQSNREIAGIFYAGTAVSAGFTIFFFYKYIDSQDLKIAETFPGGKSTPVQTLSYTAGFNAQSFRLQLNRPF